MQKFNLNFEVDGKMKALVEFGEMKVEFKDEGCKISQGNGRKTQKMRLINEQSETMERKTLSGPSRKYQTPQNYLSKQFIALHHSPEAQSWRNQ